MRIPYLRAQPKRRRTYLRTKNQLSSKGADWGQGHCLLRPNTHFQQTFGKKGSPGQTSIAQYGMGKRIQFNPAPAISAMSCSVYKMNMSKTSAAAVMRRPQRQVSATEEGTGERDVR